MEPSLGLVLHGGGGGEQTAKEAELELGLGLSLGGGGGGGGGAAEKSKGCAWGHEYGRILTAKDFPNGFSSAGTKRERTATEGSASAAVSNQVVGWPPIRAYRMNTMFNQSKTSNVEDHDKRVGENENNDNSNKKINHGNESVHIDSAIKKEVIRGHLGFVKVNMDGLPIGRKVDLNAHKSYDTLANTLEDMFFNPSIRKGKESPKLLDGSSEFVLTYEDREGDWMLVGDVPWGMFFSTVKRLRIMRKSEANGLAPKFQEKNEKQKSKII